MKKVLISMQKTTSYFVRKMELMQKLTTMSWIADKIRRKNKGQKKEYPRMYFRYETMEGIEERLIEGQVLSGLTTMVDYHNYLEDHIWLVFGKQRSKVSIVPLWRKDNNETETLIGFSYHSYELDKDKVIENMTTEELKKNTSNYCVMLPFVREKDDNFNNQYAVVFDDWDVIDAHGVKRLPTLCPREFDSDAKRC